MRRLEPFFARRQPFPGWRRVALAGTGGALAIATLAGLTDLGGWVWIAAPFGASCVLIFTAPEAPLSQPANVIAGHMLSTAIGLLAQTVLPASWWSTALAVGIAIAAMAALRVTHPPAGADPIVVMAAGSSWTFLLTPVLIGAVTLVIVGALFHKLTGTAYPTRPALPPTSTLTTLPGKA